MTTQQGLNQKTFRRILAQNVFLPLILLAGLSAIFVGQLSFMVNNSHWVDHSDQAITMTSELVKGFVDAETGMRGFIVTGREHFLEPYNRTNQQIGEKFSALEKHLSDNPSQVRRVEEVDFAFRKWLNLARSAIDGRTSMSASQMLTAQEQGKSMMDDLRARIHEIESIEVDLRKTRLEKSEETTRWVIFSTLAISIIVGALLAYLGRKQLMGLAVTYEDALKNQTDQNEKLLKQAWLQTGQADLADLLRGELSFKEICEKSLSFVAKYLGAQIGALYVQNDDDRFVRISTFAFDPVRVKSPEVFRPGESLVGQIVLSRAPKLISDLPPDYITVSSGLGNSNPRQLLLAPFMADGKTNSVIELGFFQEVQTSVIDLMTQISETVGTALRSAQYRERLTSFLEETQRQAEELQTQQEELRVANEELEEQTKALKESQTKLESNHAELEQTNENLEEQTRLLEHQKDQMEERAKELSESREALEMASQYKSQFLANMSHELRTPLNSSLILAKLLMDNRSGNLNAEQVEFASTIYSSGNDLLNLINDILDLSKVEAGKLELRVERFDISRMVEGLRSIFNPLATQKSLDLKFTVDPSVSKTMEADQQRVEQILKNLLSNAIKFTAKGTVGLAVGYEKSNIIFTVQDSGIGIPKDQQELIFHAFRQADETTSRKYGGTGLGLSIARDLSGLLGGNVFVESEEGRGSVFRLTLPEIYDAKKSLKTAHSPSLSGQSDQNLPPHAGLGSAKISASHTGDNSAAKNYTVPPKSGSASSSHFEPTFAPVSIPVRPPHKGFSWPDDRALLKEGSKTLLVIEDDEAFAKILFNLAHEMKFQCIVAETADEGFDAATYYLPNAIILDLQLPDHLGLTVLDRLKTTSRTRHIPVHICSALDRSETALQMGAIGFLKKPAKMEELQSALKKLEDKVSKDLKAVLVVEDDATQRMSICKLIGAGDIETTAVGTGQEALDLLKTKTFDCVIIDLTLPDFSGYELLQKMTDEGVHAYPPVIVYTGRSLSRDEEDKLRKYSRSVIIKGAKSPERLVDEVSLFLHRVESKLPQERQTMLMESRRKEKVFEGRTILVVDDDVRNIFALSSALEQKGARIEVARNGKEALTKLDTQAGIEFVLMDIMMPEMDGYEAMKRIRAQSKFQKVPIIALTAKAMRDDQERCIAAGANDYLAKPIDLDKLVSLIRVWMPT